MAGVARLLLIGLWAALAQGASCGGARTVPDEIRTAPQARPGLGPGDLFEVRVYGEEELTAQYRIETDGTIDFPFLGRLDVEGKLPREVAELVAVGLREREILRDPQVTVFVAESNSLRVTVMGAVARPGTFPVVPGMTAVQAVSMAGGFTALANQNDTVLTRRDGDTVRRFSVPMRRISDGREADIDLHGGDIIFVPERTF
jgi:polysaccharide export outer membrane protein